MLDRHALAGINGQHKRPVTPNVQSADKQFVFCSNTFKIQLRSNIDCCFSASLILFPFVLMCKTPQNHTLPSEKESDINLSLSQKWSFGFPLRDFGKSRMQLESGGSMWAEMKPFPPVQTKKDFHSEQQTFETQNLVLLTSKSSESYIVLTCLYLLIKTEYLSFDGKLEQLPIQLWNERKVLIPL